jgi:hypothetical protein
MLARTHTELGTCHPFSHEKWYPRPNRKCDICRLAHHMSLGEVRRFSILLSLLSLLSDARRAPRRGAMTRSTGDVKEVK